ncbi:DUF4214 domain-containing protein [Chromatocurvus halotolerans]|uniref:Uncharacterized protein DUF4214 n=1 Tax=Chromatocurvus halotolerans TaxID=1132028 RepID=A0A4V2SB18_9GAMM|nr:DUF4214 domain-containing protein [Chromatocurvus halotolerans]TCO73760.1 uncharacterized protein DUF4214 [Chromatocurvus halotolerans]
MANASSYETAQKLYIAYYQRPADPEGLRFWADQIENAGGSLEVALSSFANSVEAQELYGDITADNIESVVENFYQAAFGRAADAEGLAFYVNGFNDGTFTPASIALNILDGASGGDLAVINNKVIAADRFTNAIDGGARDEEFGQRDPQFTYDADDIVAAREWLEAVSSAPSSVPTASETLTNIEDDFSNPGDAGVGSSGQTFTLTTDLDSFTGTSSNDLFVGTVDDATPADATLNGLDSLDGGAGIDTLRVADTDPAGSGFPAGLTLSSIENVTARAAGTAKFDTSDFADVVSLASTQSAAAELTGSATQDISVSGATGAIDVEGGNNITVNDAADNQNINVGESGAGSTNAAGTISVTDSKQGDGDITIDGGTDVTVNATTDAAAAIADAGDVVIGATKAASGDVVVVQNVKHNGEGGNVAQADISVTGGTTVDVTVNATSTAKDQDSDNDILNGTVTVTGDDATKSVSVVQNNSATTFTKPAVAVIKETSVVTFKAMSANETLIVNGLTFTASKALTAEQVAGAFADLAAADTQSATGPTANGIYTGTFNTAVWTSGARDGATVTFTANDEDEADLVFTGTATTNDAGARAPTQVKSAGAASVDADTSTNTVTIGDVVVNEGGSDSITEITLDTYKAATLGAGGSLDALTTLSLANSADEATVTTAATTLALNVDDVDDAVSLDGTAATVETLNLTASGDASTFALTSEATKTLNVTANAALNLTGSTLTVLESAVVSGAGNVTLGDISGATKTLDASGATGNISATVDGTTATVTTSSGNDSITVDTAGLSKNISLGGGNDTLTFSEATANVPTAGTVDGGDGVDTVAMTSASAQALDNNTNFATAISGFERLTITDTVVNDDTVDQVDTIVIDTAALGFSYITTSGTVSDPVATADTVATRDVLQLDNLANDGTVVLTATGNVVVNVKDAATGASDVVNLQVSQNGDTDFGSATIANVETVNIDAIDSVPVLANGTADIDEHTLSVSVDSATSLNLTGSADLDLTVTDDAVLTTVNASAMTGALTYVADGTLAQTVTGGSGDDHLTGAGSGDTLIGGAGKDTFVVGAAVDLLKLDGGDGTDTFDFNGVSSNKSNFAVVQGVNTGDIFDFDGITGGDASFRQAQITLSQGATESTQAFLDQAMTNLGDNGFGWFQFNGNTYIAGDVGGDSANAFVDGTDFVVMLTGLVDLSAASFNGTNATLELG